MREWLAGLVGESMAPIVSVVVSAAIVFLLALVIIGLAKRVFAGSGGMGGRSRAPRLAILDVSPVDPKRKLVLVRRDDTEHLLLIGGQNDLVVESGIQRVRTRRVEPPAAGRAEPEMPVEPQAAQPQRRVLPAVQSPSPTPVPVPVPVPPNTTRETPAARPAPIPALAPAPEPESEPADLRAPPVAARALPQDRAPDRVGERPLPARAPSEERQQPAPEAAAPALPPFPGVTTDRAQPTTRPQSPATAPVVTPPPRPVAEAPRVEPPRPTPDVRHEAPPLAPQAPIVPPTQPRSMATPTLPSQTPVQAQVRAEPSPPRSEPEQAVRPAPTSTPPVPLLADEPLLPTEEPPAPRQPSSPAPAETRDEASGEATDEAVSSPERQPLSVRSFATTIQARRANPMPPVAPVVPAAPPVVAAPPPPLPSAPASRPSQDTEAARTSSPGVKAADEQPVQTRPAASDARQPASPPAVTSQPPARTLTLEEEMERLLHDFTLDVSDRR